ncbi:MAG: hypothetical protein KJO79_04075, partial [Verrucomicrobiae bacterium]|nr:hypothetical protein [Verrucomicrobiae bacterium]
TQSLSRLSLSNKNAFNHLSQKITRKLSQPVGVCFGSIHPAIHDDALFHRIVCIHVVAMFGGDRGTL